MSDITYAVLETNGGQIRVSEGDLVYLDRGSVGEKIELDSVMAVRSASGLEVGDPYVKNVKVTALVGEEVKGPKITILKFRKRKNSRRKNGHRQRYFAATVESINAGN